MNRHSRSAFRNLVHCVGELPQQRWPWLFVALISTVLLGYALYTQHGPQQLWPCVQCIYQRTAMVGVALFCWLGFFSARFNRFMRWTSLIGWLGASIAGVYSAYYHSWIQSAINPLFAPCQPHPNFPSWAPLHVWLPQVFDAGGLCGDIDWQWAGLSMPQWLFVIFSAFATAAVLVILCHLWRGGKHV